MILFRTFLDVLNIALYTKLGFHKEMYFKYNKRTLPVYSFTGGGGECIRGYLAKTEIEYSNKLLKVANLYNCPKMVESTGKVIGNTFSMVKNIHVLKDESSSYILKHVYNDTRCRNHFGKAIVESIFSNTFTLTPLMDLDLRKISFYDSYCNDDKLLIALIYARYCPDLLNFSFEGGRSIDPSTIDYAKELNKKYPFHNPVYDVISGPTEKDRDIHHVKTNITNRAVKVGEPDRYLRELFYSTGFKHEFLKYYPLKVYSKICEKIQNANYFPLRHAYSAIAVIKILREIEYGNKRFSKCICDDFDELKDSFVENIEEELDLNKFDLQKYLTARFDIKNIGSKENRVEIVENTDTSSFVHTPAWFTNESGIGTVIESSKLYLGLKIRCIKEGGLQIGFLAKDFRDLNDATNRIPIYVKYIKIKFNGKDIIEHPINVCHDKHFSYFQKVMDDEIVELEVEWGCM